MDVRSDSGPLGQTLPKRFQTVPAVSAFICCVFVCSDILCAVSVWCYHLSGTWLLHCSQLFSVFLPPAYGLLCSQQSFIGFLLMVRAPSAPLGALFVLPLLPLRLPSACSRGSKVCSLLPVPNYACLAFALPASTCLPLCNLLVTCGFCLAGHFLLESYSPHHQAGSLNHTVLLDSL